MNTGKSRLVLLALLAGGIPLVAVHLALHISISHGFVEPCVPYLDGCTSISRAGRHGLANSVFQGLMLPYAVVLASFWIACADWLRRLGEVGPTTRLLPWLGLIAAVFLVLYVAFLGTDGEVYRLLRRYGVIFYFAANFMAQLLLAARLAAIRRRDPAVLPRGMAATTVTLCVVMLVLGLANVAGSVLLEDNDVFENIIEWNAALVMTAYFFVIAVPGNTWQCCRARGRRDGTGASSTPAT